MSRRVTHYVNGRPQYRDEGPARARPVGHGGSAMGTFTGVIVLPRKPAAKPSKVGMSASKGARR